VPGMECRLGVLALGDSITHGGGELQWGVALQSWALWTARGLGLPYTGWAMDGARAADVVGVQLPLVPADARYDLGCLYVGVNDVRAPDWDAAAFAHDAGVVVAFLRARCSRVLACTIPRDLGRPRAGRPVEEANAVIRAFGGVLLVDLSDFRARNHVMVDAVHPTAFGQVAIAERALRVLAADGMTVERRPSELLRWETTPWRRLRGDATYAYRQAKQAGRLAYARVRGANRGVRG
jgi:lysophospholipase L1-like esterase